MFSLLIKHCSHRSIFEHHCCSSARLWPRPINAADFIKMHQTLFKKINNQINKLLVWHYCSITHSQPLVVNRSCFYKCSSYRCNFWALVPHSSACLQLHIVDINCRCSPFSAQAEANPEHHYHRRLMFTPPSKWAQQQDTSQSKAPENLLKLPCKRASFKLLPESSYHKPSPCIFVSHNSIGGSPILKNWIIHDKYCHLLG